MSDLEQTYLLALKVAGDDRAAELTKRVDDAEKSLKQLIKANGGVGASAAQMSAQIQAEAANLKSLKDELEQVNRANAKLAGGFKSNTQGINQLGYAIEDLQYGFKGISNNIQPILSGFAATAKFAGPISILATVGYQLYENWSLISKLWGEGHTETEAERMEKLRRAASLTADEYERLKRSSAVTDTVKDIQQAKAPDQQAEADAVKRAIVIAGPREVAKGVLKNAPGLVDSQPDVAKASDEVKKIEKERDDYIKSSKKWVQRNGRWEQEQMTSADALEGFRGRILDAQKNLNDQREKTATQLAATGALPDLFPGGRARLADAVRKDPKAFGAGGDRLAEDLDKADPTTARLDKAGTAIGKAVTSLWEKVKEKAATETEKAAQKAEKETGGIASDVLRGANADKFLSGNATVEDAAAELKRRGISDIGGTQAKALLDAANEQADKLGAEEATKRGLGSVDAGRASLRQKLADQQQAEADKATREKVAKIKDDNPELPNLLMNALVGTSKLGGSLEEKQAELYDQIASRFGSEAAKSLLDDAGDSAKKTLLSDYLNGEKDKDNQVRVLNGSAALRDSIQSAVKADDSGKKIVERLDRTNQLLQEAIQVGGGLG